MKLFINHNRINNLILQPYVKLDESTLVKSAFTLVSLLLICTILCPGVCNSMDGKKINNEATWVLIKEQGNLEYFLSMEPISDIPMVNDSVKVWSTYFDNHSKSFVSGLWFHPHSHEQHLSSINPNKGQNRHLLCRLLKSIYNPKNNDKLLYNDGIYFFC